MTFTINRFHAYSLATLIMITGGLASNSGLAQTTAFYKCVDENGNTKYNDSACAANESTELISRHATTIAALDCRIAHNFLVDSAARWLQGDSQADLIDTYGGSREISRETRNIIDYIYSFTGQSQSVSRIIALAIQRCEAGLFGEQVASCDRYPTSFIESFGSCVKARQPESGVVIRSEIPAAASNSMDTAPTLNAANPADPIHPASPAKPKIKSKTINQ